MLALAVVAAALTAAPASADPAVSAVTVSNVLGGSAHLSGTVDPGSRQFAYFNFQYSTNGEDWINGDGGGLSATGPRNVASELTHLTASTKYYVRLTANDLTNPEVFSPEPFAEFETLPVAKPAVLSTDDATAVFSTTADVSGSVERPAGSDPAFNAECSFEYVTEAAFQAKDEEQSLIVRATGGTFVLGFEGQTTAPIAFDASSASVQAALEGLPGIGVGTATVSGGPGDEAGTAPYAISFTGALGHKDVEAIAVDPSALTVEGESGAEVLTTADGHPEGFNNPTRVPCKPNPVTSAGSNPVGAGLTGLEPSTTYHLRLSASNAGGSDSKVATSTFTTTALPVVGAPTVLSANDATEVATTTAKVSGSLERPAGADPLFNADCEFEYITDGQFNENEANGAPGFEGATQAPCEPNPITAAGTTLVTANLAKLLSGTTYHLRLTASNFGGTSSLEASNFKTKSAVLAQTLDAGSVQTQSAILSGRINPDNASVSYQFEWGQVEGSDDESYENVTPASPEPLGAADKSFHVVSATIGGLQPEVAYHYRISATDTTTGLVVNGVDRIFSTRMVSGPPQSCPNESSRVGPSAGLPDCRAYELATPGLNGSALSFEVGGEALADGSGFWFSSLDAPVDAEGSFVFGRGVARKGPAGWTTKSLVPPTPGQSSSFISGGTVTAISSDLSQSVVLSEQPLAGPGSPIGSNLYLHRADGSFVALTNIGPVGMLEPGVSALSRDSTHIFFTPCVRQFSEDPLGEGNTYEWANGDLRLVGYLPGAGGVPAPGGAVLTEGALPSISDSGRQALFNSAGAPGLYLRTDGQSTVDVSASQRAVDLGTSGGGSAVGISADGSKVLFTSAAELTEDADTGTTEGVSNDQGADLYSYDVHNGELTDLTVDEKSADAATGADVQRVLGASGDASYVYFVATGDLASGAISGQRNLYAEHDGQIDYVASDPFETELEHPFYVTPDGRHIAFLSSSSLTGYDNTNPDTGQPELEVFSYSYNGTVECASCRPDGAPPTGGATLATGQTFSARSVTRRALSDDGSRVFFQSRDAIVPQASNGLQNVYEYESGHVHLLSTGDGEDPAHLLDVSGSGDDVFIITHDELAAGDQGTAAAVYDARVNADVSRSVPPHCSAEACLGAPTAPPAVPSPGSARFETPGKVAGPASKVGRASKLKVRFTVPGSGKLSVSGKGLKPATKRASRAGSVAIVVALRSAANRSRLKKGVFKTEAQILFKSSSGDTSREKVVLRFEAPAKKGGK